ncbi:MULTISPECIES: LuxR C-terminal-related transcriptional regulator [Streptomyces]|uniref:LuxR C-terminal-related transcriptional regulator n=2 Tax=Streptomyces TaxID=1883 RepID=A0AAU1TW70_9ACTN|nr:MULTISPECIES: LuxR C-terminal-related transcriptional regulator [unclassified Streptomyces]MCX4648097.1 LuxR C-terminal-related transcriptional regulator [Streptomyces sp. NBC_01446]MCX5323781.1 LuxR C-terminal-related transcriptional regulator [Streptomyces sp. NBC_00120]WSD92915.1 LuxR C-terminal-related transcriptional regulator [Streptomyces sp. NBC_01474]
MSTLSYETERRPPNNAGLHRDEVHLLSLLATGLPIESVARRLNVCPRTVRRRCRGVCDKIGVSSVIEAVAWAARRRLI